MEMDRESFRIISDVIAYREQEEDYAEDQCRIRAGTIIFAAAGANKTRMLNGRSVAAVLFTLDTSGWCWIPRDEFERSVVKFDVKQQTGIAFQT